MRQLGNTSSQSAGETSIASAATTDLSLSINRNVAVTGTTTITSFGAGKNLEYLVRFTAALTLTYNATSLILPGQVSILTATNDVCLVTSDNSGNWRVRFYARADGSPVLNTLPITRGGTGAITQGDARTNLGLGDAAVKNTGTTVGTLAAGDDSRFAAAVPRYVYVNSGSVSNVAYADITLPSTYSWYALKLVNIVVYSSGAVPGMYLSSNNGSSFYTTQGNYGGVKFEAYTSYQTSYYSDRMPISGQHGTGVTSAFTEILFFTGNANQNPMSIADASYYYYGGSWGRAVCSGQLGYNVQATTTRIFASSGNISFNYLLHGVY